MAQKYKKFTKKQSILFFLFVLLFFYFQFYIKYFIYIANTQLVINTSTNHNL